MRRVLTCLFAANLLLFPFITPALGQEENLDAVQVSDHARRCANFFLKASKEVDDLVLVLRETLSLQRILLSDDEEDEFRKRKTIERIEDITIRARRLKCIR